MLGFEASDEEDESLYDSRSEFGHGGFDDDHHVEGVNEYQHEGAERGDESANGKLPAHEVKDVKGRTWGSTKLKTPFPAASAYPFQAAAPHTLMNAHFTLPVNTPALQLAKKRASDLRRQIK